MCSTKFFFLLTSLVAIRMRPLNSRESSSISSKGSSRVWRVLAKHHSIAQSTPDGKPLPERATGRNFFTFDRVFGEDSSSKQVYDNIAQGIVKSVVTGLNGTIFAYGQTSSGKTYTVQGAGSIQEGSNGGGGGVVHMAAHDIFSHIASDPSRDFLIRVSFIEIYNEEVRDLLVSGTHSSNALQIREDPVRGVYVDSCEVMATDFDTLLGTLFAGEKKRSVAATGMNERSSRSHTIFRITVESRKRKVKQDKDNDLEDNYEDEEIRNSSSHDSDDDAAVLVSTLNLVDLAGSESVKHTGATGERQKEGGKINQRYIFM